MTKKSSLVAAYAIRSINAEREAKKAQEENKRLKQEIEELKCLLRKRQQG